MRGLLPPTPLGTPPGGSRGARLVRSPGEAGQRQGIVDPKVVIFLRENNGPPSKDPAAVAKNSLAERPNFVFLRFRFMLT
eukprot:3337249-Pyramimonas_sp.AAC.1